MASWHGRVLISANCWHDLTDAPQVVPSVGTHSLASSHQCRQLAPLFWRTFSSAELSVQLFWRTFSSAELSVQLFGCAFSSANCWHHFLDAQEFVPNCRHDFLDALFQVPTVRHSFFCAHSFNRLIRCPKLLLHVALYLEPIDDYSKGELQDLSELEPKEIRLRLEIIEENWQIQAS